MRSSNPFPPRLVLTPTSRNPTTLPEATVKAVLANPVPISPAHYDLVCFPSADQSIAFQVKRETIAQFAHHRVFYLKPDPFLSLNSPKAFCTRTVAPNLFETRIATSRRSNIYGQVSDPQAPTLLRALEALRHAYGIEAAVAYVQRAAWAALAMRARERWGWKVVYDCINQEDGFRPIGRRPVKSESRLEKQADLVIGSETRLKDRNNDSFEQNTGLSRRHATIEGWREVDRSIRAKFKLASVVIVTFNHLVYTKLCLESLLANTEYPNYEVIVVDNGSTDGTPAYLCSLTRQHPHVRVVFNTDNVGFARANNQGLAAAVGDVLILLNNDTLVPHGWLTRLVRHLANPRVGLVGPITNNIDNEAQIDVPYRTYGELVRFAKDHSRAHEGELFDISMLGMFCVAMRRDVYERVGSLDERFGVGTFEDDDYSMRIRSAGYRVLCAEDVFVHHFGQASFGKLVPTGEYGELLRANRRRFEEKWGSQWKPHHHRMSERYQQLTRRIREAVRSTVPSDGTVLVVSRGDDELLRLDGRRAWHFPQTEDGAYAGYYPADSAEAITHLERLRAKGGEFLLFPSSAFWWLEHYGQLRQHLERRYRAVVDEEDTCTIFALRELETERWEIVVQDNHTRVGD